MSGSSAGAVKKTGQMATENHEASCEDDPNFAVICGFLKKFGPACGLTNIDFLDLQEMLENTHEVAPFLIDLHIKLLRKLRKSVAVERWERAIINICHKMSNTQDAWELERFGYKKARIASKLRILKQLLEMQFDFNTKFKNEVNKMSASELRSQPLGRDKAGHAYWFQDDDNCQIRVYKEDPDEETWEMVAKDRDGLVLLINQLGNNETGFEPIINDDSNSLEIEKPILDTGQVEETTSEESSKPTSKKSSEEDDDSKSSEEQSSISKTATSDSSGEVTDLKLPVDDEKKISSDTSSDVKVESNGGNVALNEPIKNEIENIKDEKIAEKPSEELKTGNGITDTKIENLPSAKPPQETTEEVMNLKKQPKTIDDCENKKPDDIRPAGLRLKPLTELLSSHLDPEKKPEFSGIKEKYIRSDSTFSNQLSNRKAVDSAGYAQIYKNELKRPVDYDISEPSMLKRPRMDRPTLLGNKKLQKPYEEDEEEDEDDFEDEYDSEEVSDEIEEPLMLVTGKGSGADNKSSYEESPIIGEVIEEPVMFFHGSGSGAECDVGNEKEEPKKSDSISNETTKNNLKLGTIIDTKTDKRETIRSPPKKSRWDLGKPVDEEKSNVQKLVNKWENINKEEDSPPRKTFFFGPSSGFSFKSPTSSPSKDQNEAEINVNLEKTNFVVDKILGSASNSEIIVKTNKAKDKSKICDSKTINTLDLDNCLNLKSAGSSELTDKQLVSETKITNENNQKINENEIKSETRDNEQNKDITTENIIPQNTLLEKQYENVTKKTEEPKNAATEVKKSMVEDTKPAKEVETSITNKAPESSKVSIPIKKSDNVITINEDTKKVPEVAESVEIKETIVTEKVESLKNIPVVMVENEVSVNNQKDMVSKPMVSSHKNVKEDKPLIDKNVDSDIKEKEKTDVTILPEKEVTPIVNSKSELEDNVEKKVVTEEEDLSTIKESIPKIAEDKAEEKIIPIPCTLNKIHTPPSELKTTNEESKKILITNECKETKKNTVEQNKNVNKDNKEGDKLQNEETQKDNLNEEPDGSCSMKKEITNVVQIIKDNLKVETSESSSKKEEITSIVQTGKENLKEETDDSCRTEEITNVVQIKQNKLKEETVASSDKKEEITKVVQVTQDKLKEETVASCSRKEEITNVEQIRLDKLKEETVASSNKKEEITKVVQINQDILKDETVASSNKKEIAKVVQINQDKLKEEIVAPSNKKEEVTRVVQINQDKLKEETVASSNKEEEITNLVLINQDNLKEKASVSGTTKEEITNIVQVNQETIKEETVGSCGKKEDITNIVQINQDNLKEDISISCTKKEEITNVVQINQDSLKEETGCSKNKSEKNLNITQPDKDNLKQKPEVSCSKTGEISNIVQIDNSSCKKEEATNITETKAEKEVEQQNINKKSVTLKTEEVEKDDSKGSEQISPVLRRASRRLKSLEDAEEVTVKKAPAKKAIGKGKNAAAKSKKNEVIVKKDIDKLINNAAEKQSEVEESKEKTVKCTPEEAYEKTDTLINLENEEKPKKTMRQLKKQASNEEKETNTNANILKHSAEVNESEKEAPKRATRQRSVKESSKEKEEEPAKIKNTSQIAEITDTKEKETEESEAADKSSNISNKEDCSEDINKPDKESVVADDIKEDSIDTVTTRRGMRNKKAELQKDEEEDKPEAKKGKASKIKSKTKGEPDQEELKLKEEETVTTRRGGLRSKPPAPTPLKKAKAAKAKLKEELKEDNAKKGKKSDVVEESAPTGDSKSDLEKLAGLVSSVDKNNAVKEERSIDFESIKKQIVTVNECAENDDEELTLAARIEAVKKISETSEDKRKEIEETPCVMKKVLLQEDEEQEVISSDNDIGNDDMETTHISSSETELDKPDKVMLTSLSFDYTPPPVERKNLKRSRANTEIELANDDDDGNDNGGKRRKMRGKRAVDVELRKSVEEKKNVIRISSSDEDDSKKKQEEKPKKSYKKKKTLLGLDIPDVLMMDDKPSGVRQSRRIAQIKIKEEAERGKMEEMAMLDMKGYKKKNKKEKDKDFKIEKKEKADKRKPMVISDDDTTNDVESDEKKKKRKRKHKHPKFDEKKPWNSSSNSSSESAPEDEEEDPYEEEDDHHQPLKSDHEFSPESDLEDGSEVQPLKRARTVRKEDAVEEEEIDDTNCQKCDKSDHPEWILLCDGCDAGWHCSCLRPPLLVIPEGDWYCPPCQHMTLVKCLQERLVDFDKRVSKRDIEVRRKERLAYVGISLDNVLPSKEHDDAHKHKPRRRSVKSESASVSGSESSSGSTQSSTDSDDEPIYQLRQRRQAHSYRFNDYDDLINSAIREDVESGGVVVVESKGKDMANIAEAEGVETLPPVVPANTDLPQVILQEPEGSDEEVIKPVKKLIGKKKHRKLNSLDISSGDDQDDDEDFKGSTSEEEEDDFDDDMGSESSEFDRKKSRRGPVRRSTRARVSRYDREFINDDSEDEPRRKKRSMWTETESEESDRSWGRRKRRPAARRAPPTNRKKKSKKKKELDDSDVEVYRKKKPKIKYGGLESEEEEIKPRTRGKKINYLDALGTDSEDEIRRRNAVQEDESEDEFVLNEEEEGEEEGVERDSDDSNDGPILSGAIKSGSKKGKGKGGIKRIKRAQGEEEELLFPPLPEPQKSAEAVPMGPLVEEPNPIDQINKNLEAMDEKEMEMMMEEEEYANRQLQMVAEQLEKEKRRRMELEARRLEAIPTVVPPPMHIPVPHIEQVPISMVEERSPKKRGRKPKSLVGSPESPMVLSPQVGAFNLSMETAKVMETGQFPDINIGAMSAAMAGEGSVISYNPDGTPKKRRGRGKGKKTLEKEAAAAAAAAAAGGPGASTASNASRDSADSSEVPLNLVDGSLSSASKTSSPGDSPMHGGKLGVAAAPQPFSQSQPKPSVITRMLQSQPGQASYPVGTMGHKFFADRPEGAPPPGGPPFIPIPGGPRGGPPGPGYRPPPGMGPYPPIRPGASPHRLRSPGPPNMPPHLFQPHHQLEPPPSAAAPAERSSPSLASPSSASPLSTKGDPTPPPPPYIRPPIRFPPGAPNIPRHIVPPHLVQPRPPNIPYHPNMPPNFPYGPYPPPPSNEGGNSPVQFQPPYPEHFDGPPPEGHGPRNYDEENGEFGGLVSYFSSQQEDDLDS